MTVCTVLLAGGDGRHVALIDHQDRELVAPFRWLWANRGRAVAWVDKRAIYMHRLILAAPDDRHVDHINGNPLDNRRANLRLVAQAENNQNTPSRGGTSRYRSVYWHRGRGHWIACVRLRGRKHHLGSFTDERTAALAAQAFRDEHMPFAQPDPALAIDRGRRR